MSESCVLLWGTTVLSEQELAQLEPLLSVSERARADAIGALRSQRYLAGRFLARKLGAQLLGARWTSVIPLAHCLECGMDHGPITIVGTDVHISLSSSGMKLVAAGARGKRIGVDIEQGNLGDTREVAGRSEILQVTLAQWCEYEAVAKAMGLGIALGIDEVDLTGSSKEYDVRQAQQHKDVVLALALSH